MTRRSHSASRRRRRRISRAGAAIASSAPLPPRRRLRLQSSFDRSPPAGGMIAIGGPPLSGKSVLAARLAECLPYTARFETIDDLTRSRPFLADPALRSTSAGTTALLLEQARKAWLGRTRGRNPTLLVVTRFGSASERRRAKVHAQLVGMPFLFVEVRSRDQQALLRIPMNFLPRREINARLRRYDAALRSYVPVGRAEELALPALRLQQVLSGLDDAVNRIVALWRQD